MANLKVAEMTPSETGVIRVVWRLDSEGSGGMNSNPFPLYMNKRFLIISGVSGTATVTVRLYHDLSDVAGAATDFPPAGLMPLGTLGPFTIGGDSVVIEPLPEYVSFIEPVVSGIGGMFVAYVAAVGSL